MSIDSPAAILYDENGNPVAITLDGSVYRIETQGKVLNASGTQINPATETTLAAIKAKTDNLDVALSTRAVTGLTDAQLRASAVPVSNASLPLPAGAATQATLATRLAEATFTARVNTQGQKAMAASTPTVIASDQSAIASKNAAASQVDGHSASIGATTDADTALTIIGRLKQLVTQITSIKDTAGIKKITDGVQLQAGTNSIGVVKIESGNGSGDVANVDASKRLLVSTGAVAPVGTNAVRVIAQSSVNGAVNTDYTVPAGKTLAITQFFAGGETSGKESKFELWHSTDSGATNGTLLAFGYIGDGGQNVRVDLNVSILGVGTTQVVRLRRERLDAVSRELAAAWEGNQTI